MVIKELLERLHVMADFFPEREKFLQSDIQQFLTLHVVVFKIAGCIKNGLKLVLVLLKRGNDWFFFNGFTHWMLALISSIARNQAVYVLKNCSGSAGQCS
ncbi:hypothetical protein D3C87_1464820 [compost metagenome]